MSDFRAKIVAELDTSKIESQIQKASEVCLKIGEDIVNFNADFDLGKKLINYSDIIFCFKLRGS